MHRHPDSKKQVRGCFQPSYVDFQEGCMRRHIAVWTFLKNIYSKDVKPLLKERVTSETEVNNETMPTNFFFFLKKYFFQSLWNQEHLQR